MFFLRIPCVFICLAFCASCSGVRVGFALKLEGNFYPWGILPPCCLPGGWKAGVGGDSLKVWVQLCTVFRLSCASWFLTFGWQI